MAVQVLIQQAQLDQCAPVVFLARGDGVPEECDLLEELVVVLCHRTSIDSHGLPIIFLRLPKEIP